MSDHAPSDRERWEELETARLLFGLSVEEQLEHGQLSAAVSVDESLSLEQLVASLDVTWSGSESMPLPEHLRLAIRLRAEQELTYNRVRPATSGSMPSRPGWWAHRYLPWLVSAACLVFAVTRWNSDSSVRPVANLTEFRAEIISSAPDVQRADWTAGPTPISGATGDVVWSSQRQQGVMRFQGMPVNSPTQEQYQLWIFDKNQSDKTPVDGGVFDVTTEGEVLVLIDPKLKVQEAFLFAVTIEKPGGVVVSSRERLPLLANVN
ncbi:MAG: hypothetical protein DWH91_11855 [Planctomycetota bacterium]|nr:MAG: hypothetical protein DWH91_11855 [Planctomycetota bacterium]